MTKQLEQTWWTLRAAFGLVPVIAGLDKFFNLLTNWEQYLNPLVLNVVPVGASTFMHAVGVIEIVAGLVVLAGWTRFGGYLVMAWLTGIALNLIVMGAFLDVAVRDLMMALGAFTLARLSEAREEVLAAEGRPEGRPYTPRLGSAGL